MMEWIASSSLLILAVLFLRAVLGKRISAGLRYGLWSVVLARLLVPVSLFSLSVIALPAVEPPEALRQESIYVLPVESKPAEESGVRFAEDGRIEAPDSFGYARLEDEGRTVIRYTEKVSLMELLGWIWAAGAAVMAVVLIIANVRFTIRLRRVRRPLEGTSAPVPVYTAMGLPSPCLVGLFCPAVYVPGEAAANPATLRHVLAHELTHYSHRDHLWSVLRGVALAVHWWNPLVWLAVVCSRRDGELACDEGALKRLGEGERAAYGETLLALVTAKSKPADLLSFATTMTSGKRSLKERIQRIAQQPKRLAGAMVAVIALLSLSTLAAFGQAKEAPVAGSHDDAWKTAVITVQENGAPYIQYENGKEDLSGEPIPAPREWADDDLAERSEAKYLLSSPHIWAKLVSPSDGWLVACSRGEVIDTYVYKTADGGITWTEVSMPGTNWHIAAVGFLTPDRLIVAQQLYEGEAPCLITKDGGETWEEVDLPDLQVLSVGPAGPNTQTIVIEAGRYEEGPVTCFMRSPDMGDTWYLSYPTYPATTIQADLDHDGIPEDLTLSRSRRDAGYDFWSLLWLSQRGKPDKPAPYHRDSWTGMATSVHPDWTAFFLCRMDGEDYLLQYTPYMSCGLAEYSYKLFYLTVYGEEVVVQENSLEFDINFESDQADRHQFDPRAVNAFMEEINALLANSEQLVNTDEYLQETFQKEGRLYDSLGWLDGNEYGFSRDKNRSLLENLLVYRNRAAESAAFPYVSDVLSSLRKEDIRMMSWGGTNISYRRNKSLVADTLNGLAGSVEYLTDVDGDFSRGSAFIGYISDGSETQHTILLEITETDELENIVRITCKGETTVLIYSENPDNDSHYLRSVPYAITAYVEDETLYRMVYCNDALWED